MPFKTKKRIFNRLDMRKVFDEFSMPCLTWRQKLIVWYFIASFCLLYIIDEAPLWTIILVVVNFANAVRLVRKVPLPENE